MSIITDGLRSDKWRAFAKQKLQMLKDLGLSAKNYIIDGYRISLSTMDGIDKARITAPPGAVVVDRTGGNYEYRYADQYGGDFALTMSRPPAEGNSPRALFSAVGDLMYHVSSDYYQPINVYGTLSGTWYAPRPKMPSDPLIEGGYITGNFVVDETGPDVRATVGLAFTRGGCLYSMATTAADTTTWFNGATLSVARAASSFNTGLPPSATYTGFRGRAFFCRPAWGENAAMVYVFHNGGACDSSLGAVAVLAYYHEVALDPFAPVGTWYAGSVTQETIATALGLPAPCAGNDADTVAAVFNLLGPRWPFSDAPHERGIFSVGVYDICAWGPVAGVTKGVVFSFDGTAEIVDVALPDYDSDAQQAVIAEVSPGFYVCEVWDLPALKVAAIYYGSPFGSWSELAHPEGTIIRHRTVKASADGIEAVALVYADGETALHEYDGAWARRGTVAAGEIDHADVAIFGNHKFAKLASDDSPVRRTWT